MTSAFGGARDKGVRRGDLITEVNGKAIVEPAAFFEAVRAVPPRGKVRITYWRSGDTHWIEIPADVPPAKPGRRGKVVASRADLSKGFQLTRRRVMSQAKKNADVLLAAHVVSSIHSPPQRGCRVKVRTNSPRRRTSAPRWLQWLASDLLFFL